MPTYTVHAPPQREGSAADPQRFVFVRDGFQFWAFLITPIWLLYRRLWLVFILYVVLIAALEGAYYLFNLPQSARFLIELLLSVLIGFEAGSLRRWTYARRRWSTIAVVSARNLEEAERRFFSRWVEETPVVARPPVVTPFAASRTSSDVIGLFPEPGGRA
jgi:hypothetical protein